MRSKLIGWLTAIGLVAIVAMASLSAIRGQKATVLVDEGFSYASQEPSPTPKPKRKRSPSPSPTPYSEVSPSPTPTPSE